LRVW